MTSKLLKQHLIDAADDTYSALVGGFAFVSLFYLICYWLVGDVFDLVGLLNTIASTFWMIATVLFVLNLVLRKWLYALCLLPSIIMLVVVYGGYFLPKSSPNLAPDFSVLTYNVLAFDDESSWSERLAVIRRVDADIVLLQELNEELANRLRDELSETYPHMALDTNAEYPSTGQGVLSRYPIVRSRYFKRWWITEQYGGNQKLEIQLPQTTLMVGNIHFLPATAYFGIYNTSRIAREAEYLSDRFRDDSAPQILAGDFNMTNLMESYAILQSEGYSDAFREVGWGFGWTSRKVPARIDYVFYRGNLQAIESYVVADSGDSDHYPVFTSFAILPPDDD